ncbi:penicillin acylase family protein [Amycolatopsis umgeniensis]|uniref:Acyl-homoserine-lactone acylase n=1 Tax=Amycolatopsis umgeniensis TaxID=336628 RepID=A0A841BB36_9PSEU|nr:penicillin acylase family protein [Amycolatopsis umgeniensis]MBB5856140.1 acyl-homoserine-lactone acylase [Amycolatopsis umgeniensis]
MRRFQRGLVLLTAALAASSLTTGVSSADELGRSRAVISYTEYGIPHIAAKDFDGLGYGYGFAAAKDNICELANTYLTVSARRSAHLGAGGQGNPAMSEAENNLDSDLHFQRINDSGVVERLLAQPAPHGPRTEVRELVSGYVEGYNAYLKQTGVARITDPVCRGADWVRPITALDFYRHFYAIASVGGQGVLASDLARTQPPSTKDVPAAEPDTAPRIAEGFRKAMGTGELGSNGIAIGGDGTRSGGGLLLGNPHYPWQGGRRFWQSQLTIPGRFDVAGGSLLGIPLPQIGHTADLAWTHTVSTATTFGLFEVPLTPGDPTTYLVDGKPEKMTAREVKVEVKEPNGERKEISRTFYGTRYGQVIGSAFEVPLPWTTKSAHALRDGNAGNLRGLNTWFELSKARSTKDVAEALARTQGVPWVNTIAADRVGNALYSDIQVVPHVTDERAATCGTPLGRVLFPGSGLSILDGSKSSCDWGTDPGALEPGLFAPSRLPLQQRRDYELNANDSAWLANARAPIAPLPRIVGATGTTRSDRTREALISAEEGLADKSFTPTSMKDMLYRDRSRTAELAAADTAKMCAAFPGGQAPSTSGPVPVGDACATLASWDRTFRLDSRGALFFQRFVARLGGLRDFWQVPFDPARPVTTPHSLATGNATVQKAFGDTLAEFRAVGIPVDGRLGDNQAVTRAGQRIPIHGGPGGLGVLNVITAPWDPAGGNHEVAHGSSFVQVVGFSGKACPDVSTIQTYSQSTDVTSPHFADQTRLYSGGGWVRGRFCGADIAASPDLKVVRLR